MWAISIRTRRRSTQKLLHRGVDCGTSISCPAAKPKNRCRSRCFGLTALPSRAEREWLQGSSLHRAAQVRRESRRLAQHRARQMGPLPQARRNVRRRQHAGAVEGGPLVPEGDAPPRTPLRVEGGARNLRRPHEMAPRRRASPQPARRSSAQAPDEPARPKASSRLTSSRGAHPGVRSPLSRHNEDETKTRESP